MTPAPLDAFLKQMAALLDGRASAAEVERALGKSASGTARLSLYPRLVARQQRAAIDAFQQAAKVACDALAPGRFAPLRDAFLRHHPPASWAPARANAHFGRFLAEGKAPGAVVELADYAWARYEVLHQDPAAFAVRHYTHRVRDFAHQVEHEHLRKGTPAVGEQTLLLGRTFDTADLVVLTPSLAALVAVALLEARGNAAGLPAVAAADVVREAGHLHRLRLLSAAAVADLTRWVTA